MEAVTLETMIEQVRHLSSLDKTRLVQQVMAILQEELPPATAKSPRRSLLGIWSSSDVSAEDIDEARREMWGEFPREDI